ncbi:MAG TPA: alpha/beta hydrolase [Solirubrobacteraceae bacterium]|nr:alpha/beta hydrolase [Solirubrobacteraceae bacterium]
MPHVQANGQRLYYEVHGEGEPLVCIMGLGGDVSGWRSQVPVFSRWYRTIVFDNRDVGRSSYAAAPYVIEDMAADALGLADGLALGRFHLLGISMGGAIAQQVALAQPERVSTLTLCVSYASAGRMGRDRARLQADAAAEKSDDALLEELMLLTLSEAIYETADDLPAVRELVLSYPYRQRREGFIRQIRAGATHEAGDRLAALTMPVHVIGAEQDLLVPVWKSRQLAELIPGARMSVIEGGAHAVNVEHAREFNALVLEFLRDSRAVRPAF